MPQAPATSLTISPDVADLMQRQLNRGGYGSENELIREGLLALEARDSALETWIREKVVPTYDAYAADPARAQPLDEAWRDLEAEFDAIKTNEAR